MKYLCSFVLLCLYSVIAYNQNQLSVQQGNWGMKYYADGVRIKKSEFDSYLMQKDPALYRMYNYGSSNVTLGNVIGFAGGFLLGWNMVI
ncbi:MAG: hypothetical protein IPL55_03895 [Saprospiraceae bacterium]|nr:hypothetical protein [Saprospiraceae bacterium]